MKTSTFTLILGIAFLASGLLGLAPVMLVPPAVDTPPTTLTFLYGSLAGLFPTNIVLTVLRIATGVWAILAWRGVTSPALCARAIALVYGLLAVMGMIPILNTAFGWMPIHGNDIWLHGIIATLAAYFGWRDEVEPADRRSPRMDRRQRMQPVRQERRDGTQDRRFAHSRMLAGV